VGYVRVSQSDESIENQKVKIEEFAKSRGFELLGVFADVDVSGTIPPRQRPQYQAMLEFCRVNSVKTIIFYDLSRLARSVEEGLAELKRLLEEGYNVYFAGMDFLNYDVDPVLKKKIIMDFLWFAEMYVEDIKRRTSAAMERLRREGRVYHRPTVLHYLALYLSGKTSFRELTREDVERAVEHLRREFKHLVELRVPWYKIHKLFLERYAELYRRFPQAPRSYQSVVGALKRAAR
jgi:Site-specific recombinases, DNA invertase Pin homologs